MSKCRQSARPLLGRLVERSIRRPRAQDSRPTTQTWLMQSRRTAGPAIDAIVEGATGPSRLAGSFSPVSPARELVGVFPAQLGGRSSAMIRASSASAAPVWTNADVAGPSEPALLAPSATISAASGLRIGLIAPRK